MMKLKKLYYLKVASIVLGLICTTAFTQSYAGKLGVNLVHEDAFVDVVKETNRWNGVEAFDSQGWPRDDCELVLMDKRPVMEWSGQIDDPDEYRIDYSGVYKCSLEGSALVTNAGGDFTILNYNYNQNANRTTFDLVVSAPRANHGLVILRFSQTRRTADGAPNTGFRNLQVMRPGYTLTADKIFTDEYIRLCKAANFACFRYYTVQNIWGGEPVYPAVTQWSERKLPSDASQSSMTSMNGKRDGWCWEYIIELANTIKRDIWINIHISCTEDYVRHLADMLKNELDPSLNIYVENSNEVWSPTHMTHGPYNAAQANAYGISFDQNYARRCIELANLFKEVFGAAAINNRIRVICAGQSHYFDRSRQHLTYISRTFGPPKNFIYGISIALYFGSVYEKGTPQQITDGMIIAIDQSITDPSKSGYRPAFIQLAKSMDLAGGCTAYEGGPSDLTGLGDDISNVANIIRANRTEAMREVMIHNYGPGWFDIGGGLACQFTIYSDYNRYGCWGLTDDYTLPDRNHKMAAMRDMVGDYRIEEEQDTIGRYQPGIPDRFILKQNFPNPFNPFTTIRYDLPADGGVEVTLFDLSGRKIRTLVDNYRTAGYYEVQWDGTDAKGTNLASGIYIYRIVVNTVNETLKEQRKLIIAR
jgi:hypothetical protein